MTGESVGDRPAHRLVLASASAARRRVLHDAGIDAEVVISGVAEDDLDLDAAATVRALAERKASAVATRRPAALVLGCDSLLDLDGRPLGKPPSPAAAVELWGRLSGRTATLYTGHHLIDGERGRRAGGVASALIRFGRPTEPELAAYVASGEPLGLAGGFSIEGRGAPFVDGIDGSPTTVLGLSLPLLRRLLVEVGRSITDLWPPARRTTTM